jgi:hypothetical protein
MHWRSNAMTIDPTEAAASLSDVQTVERRTRHALFYGGSSTILIIWGLVLVVGYLGTFLRPTDANLIWNVLNGTGVAYFVAIGYARSRRPHNHWDWRIAIAFMVLLGFGYFWQWLVMLSHLRELPVFWSTLFMTGYILAGLWMGRFFIVCGLVVIALVLVGYFWTGPWFLLWMSAVGGGSLIAGGLWLRRVGAPS